MLVLLITLLAAPETLTYAGPKERSQAAIGSFQVSRFSKGKTLYAVSPDINLRAAPDTGAEILTKLPMGAPEEVLNDPTELAMAAGQPDYWYRVRAGERRGFLHGSHRTTRKLRRHSRLRHERPWSRRSATIPMTKATKSAASSRPPSSIASTAGSTSLPVRSGPESSHPVRRKTSRRI